MLKTNIPSSDSTHDFRLNLNTNKLANGKPKKGPKPNPSTLLPEIVIDIMIATTVQISVAKSKMI